ncbi:MAG: adenosylcobinamide-phosphate synthase CbiB [Oscillospiraceae bacterium]|nr:adenosylcobinamide-phosphate synthase CbiB [Oscillospiraceae bacterium]
MDILQIVHIIQGRRIAYIIIAAFLIDCIIGDPQNPLHPMRMIGNGIGFGIKTYRKMSITSPVTQFILGMLTSLVMISLTYSIVFYLRLGLYRINLWLGFSVEAIMCYFIIAPRALRDESMLVYHRLNDSDIEGARKFLSYIVGRDTAELGIPEIVKAAVETVAENLGDGVIAPLVFILLGGAPLGFAYKAVNTLDSMIGYRNEEFEYFGKFAARLDDVVNFLPARLSALLMILGSAFVGGDVRNAIRIYVRDRRNHKSPNSAQTEAVCAGALGLCLGGPNYYKGVLVHKPTIGDDINEPVPSHIIAANRLMYAATISAVVLMSAGAFLLSYI